MPGVILVLVATVEAEADATRRHLYVPVAEAASAQAVQARAQSKHVWTRSTATGAKSVPPTGGSVGGEATSEKVGT